MATPVRPYNLDPDFERAVTYLCATRPAFYGRLGHNLIRGRVSRRAERTRRGGTGDIRSASRARSALTRGAQSTAVTSYSGACQTGCGGWRRCPTRTVQRENSS